MTKVALVIGAGDATGGAVARRFAREGFTTCVTRRAADKLNARWHVIDTGHYPMLSTPDELTRIILGG